MKVSILVDDPGSWILPWAANLRGELEAMGHPTALVHSQDDLPKGDLSFFLGCTKIVREPNLSRNGMNVVVHPSALPKGRGFSPLAWQILEGRNEIPFSLFLANAGVDDGPVYLTDVLTLDGGELNEEIKRKQGETVLRLCLRFVRELPGLKPLAQQGEPTYYRRRRAADSRLDLDAPLRTQFPLLRVVDNDRYPAFFELDGRKYILRVEKAPPEGPA